jgi:hypothetical protein
MIDPKSDLPYIKWGLGTLLLALAVSGTVITLSQHFLDDAQQSHRTAQNKLTSAQNNLRTATDDRQNMASYAHEYSILMKRNVIGDEQRLDWIDGLERLRRRNLVMHFTYSIAPQDPYQPPVPLDTGNFELKRSEMSLTFELLHEGQLIKFFDALNASINGWFMLDGCSITRADNTANSGLPGTVPQLRAECTGGWLTLKNRNTP